MQRRKFIQTGATATSGFLLSSLTTMPAMANKNYMQQDNFQLKILATSWGYEGSVDSFCAKAKQEGYDGIEMWWPGSEKDKDELFVALRKHGLDIGFLAAGHESDYAKHAATFKAMVTAATESSIKPLYINCHSGKDYFTMEENSALIEFTIALSKKTGIKICHETHRSRMLFSAPVARQFFKNIPGLRITLDVSHWCNVSESLLQDQPDTIATAIQRADHIHARVGHPEGPQVNDPRAPEWADAVKAHFDWWDKIIAIKKQEGGVMTILTEFGPPDYMPTLPYTRQPVANQWEINVHMMHELRKRYA